MILNRVSLLKPRSKKTDYYELFWEGSPCAGGSLEQMSDELEYLIDHYNKNYYCADWQPAKSALLISRYDENLRYLFEIKEAQ